MTSGSGTIHIPKDILFENLLKQEFHNDKFEKIIYYDVCIIVKDGKRYGKIIICDDSIYSYVDALNKFNLAALFKDIYSIEIINNVPDFIFGNMKKKNIHIRIKFYKRIPIKIDVTAKTKGLGSVPRKKGSSKLNDNNSDPQFEDGKYDNNNNNSNEPPNGKTSLSTTRHTEKLENEIQIEDSIDFYILNVHSIAFHLLKRARINYLIRQTLFSSQNNVPSTLYLSQLFINRLFDNLLLDMTSSRNSLPALQEYLMELLESGLKYTRIKILFWSKPNLFQFLVTQFTDNIVLLVSIGKDSQNKTLNKSSTKTIYSHMNCLHILLQIFNTFFFETDHFSTKSNQLRIDNGKWALSLIKGILSIIGYLNECDQNDELESDLSDLEIELDCLKHSVMIGSIQLFYHLICSSEVCISDQGVDSFTIRTVLQLLESMITYNSSDGLFNRFVNQALHMLFIWIFPKVYKFHDQTLTPERIVTVYQFFSSMRTIVQCAPKISKLFRQEMEEEFEHFILSDLSFPTDCPLSSSALKLLKSFQKNMLDAKDIFIDYY